MEKEKIYVGLTLKKTEEEIQYMMEAIGFLLAKSYTLRAISAIGIENPFEIGCKTNKGKEEIIDFNIFSSKIIDYCNNFYGNVFSFFPEEQKKYILYSFSSILSPELNKKAKFVMTCSNGFIQGIHADIERLCKKESIDFYDLNKEATRQEIQNRIDIMVKNYKDII